MLLAFTILILLCVGTTWFLFRILVDRITTDRKVQEVEHVYSQLNDYFGTSTFFDYRMRQTLDETVGQQYMLFLYCQSPQVLYTTHSDEGNSRPWYMVATMVYNGMFSNKTGDPELLEEKDDYTVYRMPIGGNRLGSAGETEPEEHSFIDLYGKLDNGFVVLVRTDCQRSEANNRVMTDTLLLIGAIVLCLAALTAVFFARAVMRPIKQMSEHAERMANMDFEARCEVCGDDEIGVLGESLNRLSEKLQETVGELKNANSELQSDLEQRERIDTMRSEFIANVSHELKTPIALIQGYAEGLTENVSDDAESRAFYCSVITDEAAKMNKLVQKLMTLNQLEFGGNQVEYERFDIVSLLSGVLNSTEVLRNQKGITLHYHETEPVYVWADEYMIEEVVTNYISNAINHASKTKQIAVSLEKDGEGHVRVSVYNTGELIPEEELDRIWIKFYKVDKARSRAYGGSGIGLSIVKAVMERHHQKYGVINHENGVEFWFELELATESVES